MALDHRTPLFPLAKQELIQLPDQQQLLTLPTPAASVPGAVGHASPGRVTVCRHSPAPVPISPAAAVASVSAADLRVASAVTASSSSSSFLLRKSSESVVGEPAMGGRHPWMSQTAAVERDPQQHQQKPEEMVVMPPEMMDVAGDVAGVGGGCGGGAFGVEDMGEELLGDLNLSDFGDLPSLLCLPLEDWFLGLDEDSLVQGPQEVAAALDFHRELFGDLDLDDPLAS